MNVITHVPMSILAEDLGVATKTVRNLLWEHGIKAVRRISFGSGVSGVYEWEAVMAHSRFSVSDCAACTRRGTLVASGTTVSAGKGRSS